MIGAVAGTLLVGGGVAAAAGIFSSTPDEVERGIPGGSVIVTGTDPRCTTVDGIIFDCMLAHVPTEDISLYADRDFVGALYDTVDDQSITNGGCRAQDPEGLHWTCYVGERAVEENILDSGNLGEFEPFPGVG